MTTLAERNQIASERAAALREIERDREAYIDEIAAMIETLWESIPDEAQRAELARREFYEAWKIFRHRHALRGPGYVYQHSVWRDAIARRMGWLHGRRGDGQWVHQRRLEDAGQTRIPGT